jgi:hypothetical protein
MILVLNKAIEKQPKWGWTWCCRKMDMPMIPGMDNLFK